MRKLIHKAIQWYMRRCGGAFHANPYGPSGRYVVLMNESEYHRLRAAAPTIQECIDRGWVDCFKCGSRRAVGSEGKVRGMVAGCDRCGEAGYWNLFVQALPAVT